MKQLAYTLDVSPKGARLAGVKGLKSPGQLIVVRRNTDEAQFRVIWIGRLQTAQEGQIGIECVERDKIIWDVDFSQAEEDFQPLATGSSTVRSWKPATPTEEDHRVYGCPGSAKVWADEIGAQRIEAGLTRIGFSGCEIETAAPLPLKHPLLLHLTIGETQLTVRGARREKHTVGTWIEFTHVRRGDRATLVGLIARLSGGKSVV